MYFLNKTYCCYFNGIPVTSHEGGAVGGAVMWIAGNWSDNGNLQPQQLSQF